MTNPNLIAFIAIASALLLSTLFGSRWTQRRAGKSFSPASLALALAKYWLTGRMEAFSMPLQVEHVSSEMARPIDTFALLPSSIPVKKARDRIMAIGVDNIGLTEYQKKVLDAFVAREGHVLSTQERLGSRARICGVLGSIAVALGWTSLGSDLTSAGFLRKVFDLPDDPPRLPKGWDLDRPKDFDMAEDVTEEWYSLHKWW